LAMCKEANVSGDTISKRICVS